MKLLVKSSLIFVLIVLATLGVSKSVFAVTLQEAFESALKVDPALRSSRYNQDANNENIAIARSRLLPQISLQGSSNQLTQTTIQDVPGAQSISRSFSGPSVNHQLVIRQALLRPKDNAALSVAELQSKYGELKYQSDITELWLRVVNTWIDLIGASQLVSAYEKPLQSLLDSVKQERAKLAQGDSTKDVVIEAEAQYQFAKATHQQALNSLNTKKDVFYKLTQIRFIELQDIKLDLNPKPRFEEVERDKLWAFTKGKSYELKIAELQELIQRERIRIASADHLPTLDLLATWNLAKNDATSTQGYQYKNNQIGIQYTIPIYAGGSISAGNRQALFALEASMADSEVVSNKVEADFVLLWANWLSYNARVQAGYKLLLSSEEQVKATRLSYVHGVKTITEVANSELALSRRISDQINLVVELQKYSARILRGEHFLE